jgi:hypothetical protein
MTRVDKVAGRIECDFPDVLHPVSEGILNNYVDGVISVSDFLRWFSMPNSEYIDLAQCIVLMLEATR